MRVSVVVAPVNGVQLALRIPERAGEDASLTAGDQHLSVVPGYAQVPGRLQAGDEVSLELPMNVRWVFPDPRIERWPRGERSAGAGGPVN